MWGGVVLQQEAERGMCCHPKGTGSDGGRGRGDTPPPTPWESL